MQKINLKRMLMLWMLPLCIILMAMGNISFSALGASDQTHFNVGLVIDGSGSLNSTDPQGVRYGAMDLFLALLTDGGNQVDTLIFNDNASGYPLHTGLLDLRGRSAKLSLSQEIKNAPVDGDTDIGTSLLDMVQGLKTARGQNGLPGVVILFSDGRTDLGKDEKAYKKSLENKEEAIVAAQDAGIPIYTICLNASQVADPAELQEIAQRTSGDFLEVSRPEDLERAFESFYKLIFSTSGVELLEENYDQDGTFEYVFEVPRFGAEEVNIILDSKGVGSTQIFTPQGEMTQEEITDATMTAGNYQVIKLVSPQQGTWRLFLRGTPQDKLTVNILYSVNIEARLEAGSLEDLVVGTPLELKAYVMRDGLPIQDEALAGEYKAAVHIKEVATGTEESYEMTPQGGGMFGFSYTPRKIGSYTLEAEFSSPAITVVSDSLQINAGNTAPALIGEAAAGEIEKKVTVTPFGGHKTEFNLSEYFEDMQDGKSLTYSIASSQLVKDSAQIQGDKLSINTRKSKSGNVEVMATDKDGGFTLLKVHMRVTNLEYIIDGTTIVLLLAGIIALFMALFAYYHRLFKGQIRVRNIDGNEGLNRPMVGFRGRKRLFDFMVGECGFDQKKTYFFAKGGNRLVFKSNQKFYDRYSSTPKSEANVSVGSFIFYADAEHTRGIEVKVEPKRG